MGLGNRAYCDLCEIKAEVKQKADYQSIITEHDRRDTVHDINFNLSIRQGEHLWCEFV